MSIEPIKSNPIALSNFMGQQIYIFTSKVKDNTVEFIGSNRRKIVMLLDDSNNEYLSTQAEEMFKKLLGAVKLSMDDLVMINLAKQADLTWEEIKNQFNPDKIILWGVMPDFADREATKYVCAENLLYADDLNSINADVELKKKLWPQLQKMFL